MKWLLDSIQYASTSISGLIKFYFLLHYLEEQEVCEGVESFEDVVNSVNRKGFQDFNKTEQDPV